MSASVAIGLGGGIGIEGGPMSEEITEGLGRRELLRRGAILGGAVAWTTPVVQSLTGPAFAAASPAGQACVEQTCSRVDIPGGPVYLSCEPAPGFAGCLCRCGGDLDSPCAAPDPCAVPIVCTIVLSCTV